MKKFLTVLLALSVVFTYSFSAVGTVFAATTDAEKAEALKEAKAVAEKIVTDYYDAAMKDVVNDNLGYTEADADEVAAAWAKIDVKADLLAKINELYVAESKLISDAAASDNYDANINAYAAKVFNIAATSEGDFAAVLSYTQDDGTTAVLPKDQLVNFIKNIDGLQAVLNMFNADREKALSALDYIDWSVYSTDVDKTDADGRTYLKIAEDKIAKAKEDAEALEVYKVTNLDWTFPAWFVGRLNANIKENFVDTIVEAQKVTVSGTQYPTGLYLVKGVPTKEDVSAGNAADAATIAAQKASAASAYAQFIKDRKGEYKTFADAWLKVVNFLADQGMLSGTPAYDSASSGTLLDANGTPIDPANTSYAAAVKIIEELTAYGEKYKAEKDATGAVVRDAADVDAIVEEYTSYLYGNTYGVNTSNCDTYTTVDKAEEAIRNASINSDAQKLAFAKEQYKTKLADDLAALGVEDNYYALEAAVVQANYDAGIAQIEAATTPTKVKSAYDAINLTKKADNKENVDKLCKYTSASPEKAALDAVEAYVKYANSGKTILDASYIVWNEDDAKDAIEKVYGEAGARTAAERKGVSVDAAAIAATLSTIGGLDAAKKAAEDAIKALPAKITVDNKDEVIAAWKLAEDYTAMTGSGTLSNASKLDNSVNALYSALAVDFAKKISAVDKNDKAALKALQDEIDAVNDLVEADEIFDGKDKIDAGKVIDTAVKAIRAKELEAVKKLINALPINVTLDDKAQIEAARQAYDAFVEEWTDYREPYNAVAEVGNFRELALAEAALSILEKDAAIKAVESLKITVSTKLYKGSKIRVKWTVKGDASNIDGYKVYKSTKAQKGYKFMGKTKKSYMDNKKNLKKGTRYFYKVRAYKVVDGVTYYSDYSNKGNRIYKK